MMDKKDIVIRLVEHYTQGNKRRFAFMLGVSPTTINAWIRRNTLDVDILSTKCTGVNPSFLLTGEGDMLLSQHDKTGATELKEHNEGKKNITMDDRTLDRILDALDRIVEQGRKNQEQFDRVLALFDRVLSLQERAGESHTAHHPLNYLSECHDG